MTKGPNYIRLLPVLFSFLVMGFVDVVGISANYVKNDFNLNNTMANFLPMMVFIWFAVFSIPSGILMNRIGRKITVQISLLLTCISLVIPLIYYSYFFVLIAFGILGIANTVLQVSLNPLVSNIVKSNNLTSVLTLGQFIKALSSLSGPIIAVFAANALGNWKYLFPIFAVITLISFVWLLLTNVEEEHEIEQRFSFKSSLLLLRDKKIFILFLGILAIVGIDVGMNITSPKLLLARTDFSLERAGLGTSVYFTARMIGTFLGAIFLTRISSTLFLIWNVLAAIVITIILLFIKQAVFIFIAIALIGFTMANVFPIIFSIAIQYNKKIANETSGLMIMGVAGGALLPPIIGFFTDIFGQAGGIMVILFAILYLLYLSINLLVSNKSINNNTI